MRYAIEARSFRVALAWAHNFWVLRHVASGKSLAELHGLAYDRVRGVILPIGTNASHGLRVFVFPHEREYALRVGRPISSTRMFARSRGRLVYQGEDALARWDSAVAAMRTLDALDLTYPPYGFNVLRETVNSNSAYRTFGEIMGVPIPAFPGAFAPGVRARMMPPRELELARFKPAGDPVATS